MASPFNDGIEELTRAEHIAPLKTGDNIQAKRTANYVWNTATEQWERMEQPGGSSSSGKATDAYGWQATSDDGTYKYFYFEDATKNYFIMRKHKTNKVATYTKGTGGYESVYVSVSAGPSGTPTWDSYGDTF